MGAKSHDSHSTHVGVLVVGDTVAQLIMERAAVHLRRKQPREAFK